jgi:alkanesulfonate monooxygenase SsuD/methylene tetrahydromethanopterin reductase-like flavin-dependent oxidoreductase (luciferase family)
VDFGAHLPLIDFDGDGYSLASLTSYAEAARDLGYAALAANDHMLFSRPWLDGPTALAATVAHSGSMQLMTTVALPIIRGPVQTAKTLASIDILSGGRLIAGVGPGSSRADYDAVGLDFEERWKRLDEAVKTLRALWSKEHARGRFYSTEGVTLEPETAQAQGPPIWIGSWGSEAGLRRTARLADGWLASAYNTTPQIFAQAWQRLLEIRAEMGRDPTAFPNALATMWTYVTEDRAQATRIIEDVLAPMLRRSPEELSDRLTIGPPEVCVEKLTAFREAGAQRVLIWPISEPARQLETFKAKVEPLVASA